DHLPGRGEDAALTRTALDRRHARRVIGIVRAKPGNDRSGVENRELHLPLAALPRGAIEDLIRPATERLGVPALDDPGEGQHPPELIGGFRKTADRIGDDGALRLATLRRDLPQARVDLGWQGDLPPYRLTAIVYSHG